MGEVVVYLPVPGHPAMAGIAPGSGIVGEPRGGGAEVAIHYEGALYGQLGMGSLADRVSHAHGRMRTSYPTRAARLVPREALVAVGSFDPRSGRVVLTGPDSEREVAAWLGDEWLDPAELLCRGLGEPEREAGALALDVSVAINGPLARALIGRGGLQRSEVDDEGCWVAPDGRRTSAIAEALIWALVLIAEEA